MWQSLDLDFLKLTLIHSISIKSAYIDGFIEELPRDGAVLIRVEDDPLGFPSRGGS